jgi:hypothetical protein
MPDCSGRSAGTGRVPEQFARRAVEADEVALQIVKARAASGGDAGVAGEKDFVAEDNRAGGAGAGQVGFPRQAFGVAPFERRAFGVADTGAAGAAKLRPVGSAGKGSEGKEDGKSWAQVHGPHFAVQGG